MTKIARFDGNLKAFASEQQTNERTLFGQTATADDLTSQITAQFLRGWGIVEPSDEPSLQDFNAAMYTHGQLLAYLHQMGVPEFNAAQEYYLGSVTQTGGVIYVSLQDGNIGRSPASNPAWWRTAESPPASSTVAGIQRNATQAEVNEGTSQTLTVTPLTLKGTQGTAAKADLVGSLIDATPGRVLIVGYAGIGAQLPSGSESLDAETITRFRGYGTSTVGAPTVNGGAAIVLSRAGNPTIIAVDYTTGDFYYRPIGSAQTWRKFFHSGNISTFIQTLLDDPDAASARATLGVVDPLGQGQAWAPQTRTAATTYTNSTGRTIAVAVRLLTSSSSNNAQLLVNGEIVSASGTALASTTLTLSGIVPAGATYRVEGQNSPIQQWQEMR